MATLDFILGIHGLAGLKLPCAYAVLVKIVGVHLVDVEGGVAVVLPAAAEIQHIVDAAYLITARERKTERIVLIRE